MARRAIIILLTAGTLLIALSSMTLAADANRAAVVVKLGDGAVVSRCVSFSEPEITGFELLQRAGFDVVVEDQAAGALVCSIDNTGCPADDCLCQCRGGGDCIYWSYWHMLNGVWSYSAGGSSIYRISDGDIDGWTWGPSSVTEAIPPPIISFSDVCTTDVAPTNTPTPTITPTPLVVASQPAAIASPMGEVATATTTPTETVASPGATAEPAGEQTSSLSTPTETPDTTPVPATDSNMALPTAVATIAFPAPVEAGNSPGSAGEQPIAATPYPAGQDLARGIPVATSSGQQVVESTSGQDSLLPGAGERTVARAVGVVRPSPEAIGDAVAVIGAGAQLPLDAVTDKATEAETTVQQRNWLPYGALVVMLLGLGTLATIAKLRIANKDHPR